MSEPLTREQVEDLAGYVSAEEGCCSWSLQDWLDTDAALREQLARVTQEVRSVGYETVEELTASFMEIVNGYTNLREQIAEGKEALATAQARITRLEEALKDLILWRERSDVTSPYHIEGNDVRLDEAIQQAQQALAKETP